jgi:peptidoglycan/xylan/chitin deacetylase (PgdA/CDA1 family)
LFVVTIPPKFFDEKKYAIDFLFGEIWSLKYQIIEGNVDRYIISDGGAELQMDDIYFADIVTNEGRFPSASYMLDQVQAPIYFPSKKETCLFDIFGATFCFLNLRIEKTLPRDNHDRVMASKYDEYHKQPVLNLYFDFLWQKLKEKFPYIVKKERKYNLDISHDVDQPFLDRRQTFLQALRYSLGDVLKRKNLLSGIQRFSRYLGSLVYPRKFDQYFSAFDYLLDFYSRHEIKATFYFVTKKRKGKFECQYDFNSEHIKNLLKRIHVNGHKIGLHGSYLSYEDKSLLEEEFDNLISTCNQLGIYQNDWGIRQHYLRFNAQTWNIQEKVGLNYDSSVGFAETSGFRAGIVYEYPVFDFAKKKKSSLRERPLIFMDGSYLSNLYGNKKSDTQSVLRQKAEWVKRFNGTLTILWHNNMLSTPLEKKIFEDCILIALNKK